MQAATPVSAASPLTTADAAAVRHLLERDPVTHCFAASRLLRAGGVDLDPWRAGGELWGARGRAGDLSVVYLGANLVPIGTTPETWPAFIARFAALPRRCSSLVGPADEVLGLWQGMQRSWGPAREVRADQPLLFMDSDAVVTPDPRVRLVEPHELDVLLPACVAMFTEEVGVSPLSGGMASAYRARVAELIAARRALARIENGRVVFKAEIGAVSDRVCQVQGVWVDPSRRGEGLSIAGMAAVVNHSRAAIAPCVSLYVNAYNAPARAAYHRVGFRTHGTFATILF